MGSDSELGDIIFGFVLFVGFIAMISALGSTFYFIKEAICGPLDPPKEWERNNPQWWEDRAELRRGDRQWMIGAYIVWFATWGYGFWELSADM